MNALVLRHKDSFNHVEITSKENIIWHKYMAVLVILVSCFLFLSKEIHFLYKKTLPATKSFHPNFFQRSLSSCLPFLTNISMTLLHENPSLQFPTGNSRKTNKVIVPYTTIHYPATETLNTPNMSFFSRDPKPLDQPNALKFELLALAFISSKLVLHVLLNNKLLLKTCIVKILLKTSEQISMSVCLRQLEWD